MLQAAFGAIAVCPYTICVHSHFLTTNLHYFMYFFFPTFPMNLFVISGFIIVVYMILQHVLEHGKPHERTAIIKKLTGQIVQMSQQKFASNVIEKCLTFGTPVERQTLVNEMLGSTDENEPLQVSQLAMCMLALNLKMLSRFCWHISLSDLLVIFLLA